MMVVSWNVGITQSHWLNGRSTYVERIFEGIKTLCAHHEPQT